MKSTFRVSRLSVAGALALLLVAPLPLARAFPPAPHHQIYGTVRDELGAPLDAGSATIILEATSGAVLTTSVVLGTEPGVNYSLIIPMDSGLTEDLYKATALTQTVPFQIRVKIGGVNYLPIQMQGQYGTLGKPGERTRLDLTLGADSDGDGLPDAWERALLAALGGGTLADIKPGDDSDGDGLSNLAEYIAGTYAFDPDDGFSLQIARFDNGRPVLKFLTILGRTYSVQTSTDLKTWSTVPVAFTGPTSTPSLSHKAADTRVIEVSPSNATGPSPGFYRLIVQ